MQNSSSPYAIAGARLIECGYHAIPIAPGTKRPGAYSYGRWGGMSDWQRFCSRRPTEIEIGFWAAWPDAGVGIALDQTLKCIDLDTDDPELMRAVLSVLPYSEVRKRGSKGFSAFYRGSPAIVSRPFNVGKDRVLDLLAGGRQTVVPGSIHPTTGTPYIWHGPDTLENTLIEQLPELPDDVAHKLEAALKPFGYVSPAAYQAGEGDTLWRELNDTALRNFDRWVPALCLPGTRRYGKGYRAVAAWREVENANLSFHVDGIKDWGADQPHTAIDVVMLVFNVPFESATAWLAEKLGFDALLPNRDLFNVSAFAQRCRN
ncbi:bifunctional DNA primase/polymerase [Bradyrhizobium japonicum]|uniref:bifunctional DNA primase/polymerase n=1 Tax=Bradyrhizobium japonicum TaxID=375 RepID=UPI001BA53662|nr:bifunctional DNA primase/polymerase [Bradyrhizobium japonicum]MBR0993797.1 bifunctional DNA primase/polymerase [Bradyrhizobium japonicum]